jgi:hypothetical protein
LQFGSVNTRDFQGLRSGARSVIAKSLLLKQQPVILN